MDAYEVHKRIQEAIMAVEIYNLTTGSSMWDADIKKGLTELHEKIHVLVPIEEKPQMPR